MARADDTSIVVPGRWGYIRYARFAGGSEPAKEFIATLPLVEQARLTHLFRRMAEHGKIFNETRFRQLEGDIYEFKTHNSRITCYQDGRNWYLMHGFAKKGQKCPARELARARKLRDELIAQLGQP